MIEFLLGLFLGMAVVMWISTLVVNKDKIQEKIRGKDNISRDLFGRPKKSVIIKKEEPLDSILQK